MSATTGSPITRKRLQLRAPPSMERDHTQARKIETPERSTSQSTARNAANDCHLCNFFDEIRVEVATLLSGPGEILALGQVRIGVGLDDVDGIVVREAHVDAAVVAQPRGLVGTQRDLGQPLPHLGREVLGDLVLDAAALAVANAPLG